MSTHRIDVVEIKFENHPNADALSIVRPFGYQCVVKTADWREGQLAAYIPPDYVVPLDRPEFSWLKSMPNVVKPGATTHRVKVKKFRSVMSQGLLVPAPEGAKLGDNLLDVLGVTRYSPPESTGDPTEEAPANPLVIPVYDVEAWERFLHAFKPVKRVVITEKIHGANARFLWDGERFHVGRRHQWLKEGNVFWWQALRQNEALQRQLKANPGKIFYGEVYGKVQDLQYGIPPGQYPVRIFDIWEGSQWMPWDQLREQLTYDGLLVPVLTVVDQAERMVPMTPDEWIAYLNSIVIQHSEGQSTLYPSHTREGCVVRAIPEVTDIEIGRVQLKKVGDGYLEKA